jgi:hypothetical protein
MRQRKHSVMAAAARVRALCGLAAAMIAWSLTHRFRLTMSLRIFLALLVLGLGGEGAGAQVPAPSDAAKAMVGAWEISNADRDRTCALSFMLDRAAAGFKLELDAPCGSVFPSLKDVATWAMGPNDAVRLFDSKGVMILDFTEVESGMYEAERKGEGLYFMRTQAAIKAATVTADQLFGDWTLLQEFEKPLCKLTLANASAGGDNYRITVKPGCTAPIAGFGLASWRLDRGELVLTGRSGMWRFSESDSSTWERIPPSTDPLLLMRQQ